MSRDRYFDNIHSPLIVRGGGAQATVHRQTITYNINIIVKNEDETKEKIHQIISLVKEII